MVHGLVLEHTIQDMGSANADGISTFVFTYVTRFETRRASYSASTCLYELHIRRPAVDIYNRFKRQIHQDISIDTFQWHNIVKDDIGSEHTMMLALWMKFGHMILTVW